MIEFLGITENTPIGEIFGNLFFFGLGMVGLATLAMLVVGGVMYLTAADSQDQTKRARGYMSNAVFGLVLAFLSWLILNTINPDLVKGLLLNPTRIRGATSPVQLSPEAQGVVNKQGTDVAPLGSTNDAKEFDALDQAGIKAFQQECQAKAQVAGKKGFAPEKVAPGGKINVFCVFQ